MIFTLPEQKIEIPTPGMKYLKNGDIGQILKGQPCFLSGDGEVKRAYTTNSREFSSYIVWFCPLPEDRDVLETGVEGWFQHGGFAPMATGQLLVPRSTYFLGTNVGQMVENDAPGLPYLSIELGRAVDNHTLLALPIGS